MPSLVLPCVLYLMWKYLEISRGEQDEVSMTPMLQVPGGDHDWNCKMAVKRVVKC